MRLRKERWSLMESTTDPDRAPFRSRRPRPGPGLLDRLPDAGRGERQVDVSDAEVGHGVDDGVLDRRLEGRDFIAGDGRGEYSITDMATWPWISRFDWQQNDLNDYPNVRDWYVRIAERPAVQRGYQVPKYVTDVPMP